MRRKRCCGRSHACPKNATASWACSMTGRHGGGAQNESAACRCSGRSPVCRGFAANIRSAKSSLPCRMQVARKCSGSCRCAGRRRWPRTCAGPVPAAGQAGRGRGRRHCFRTIPCLQDILAGSATANQIRDVSVNDLLGRDAVETDLASVGALLNGLVVLVSGAGGSIGSELCRTICRFEPALLVLMDKAENEIFEIERELRRTHPTVPLAPVVGDISDAIRVEQVFAEFQPMVVFHAAAHNTCRWPRAMPARRSETTSSARKFWRMPRRPAARNIS